MNLQNDDINQVNPASPDFRTELASQIAELAPEAVADGKIDVEKLKELLAEDVDGSAERFGLFWPGKRQAIRTAQTPTTATLKPDKENSKDWDTTQNVFIEGDNLEVLKILQNHYYGKIKMIYIDPPYNTGKDFVYKDDFKDGVKNYLEWSDQVSKNGKKLSSNVESDGRFHSNWLNMMYPRLKLARNLMHEDGVIFISIGTVEAAQLRKLCDEIFGERNFIADFVWEKTQHFGRQKVNTYSNYDHTLCYARSLFDRKTGEKKELLVEYEKTEFEDAPLFNRSNPENVIEFPERSVKFNLEDGVYETSTDEKYQLLDKVNVVGGRNENAFRLKFRSRWSQTNVDEEFAKGTTFWVKTRAFAIRAIYSDGKRFNESPREIMFTNGKHAPTRRESGVKVGTNEEGTAEVNRLIGEGKFDYPKPVSLIAYLVSLTKADIVLDFFAGSGSTAHAVMELNAERGSAREFIMVQLPEPAPEGSGTLSELSRMRIDRAGDELRKKTASRPEGQDSPIDLGFRSYKLVDTNFAKWKMDSSLTEEELQQAMLSLEGSANDEATPEDLLTEVLLKQGLSLTEKIEEVEIAGLQLSAVQPNDPDEDGVAVLAYLDEHTPPTLDQLREIAGTKPTRLVILEDAFHGNDELKTNLVQICKANNVELWTA